MEISTPSELVRVIELMLMTLATEPEYQVILIWLVLNSAGGPVAEMLLTR